MNTIWDLEEGSKFYTLEGTLCEVAKRTEDGKGLVATYLEGDRAGEQDFVFDEEIDFARQMGSAG